MADAAMADEIAQMVERRTVELEAPGSSILMLLYYVCVSIFHPKANAPLPSCILSFSVTGRVLSSNR